ncbi:endonuclease VII [Arthrobacter phage Yang]|uniref:HNH endonuclease n=1 Tax=Arthrobacter phage Yang TaxID=2419970 RepID=A0A3G2KJK9_9CAUD|nr:endonuclease VII [Arthrobacter phage Yang]AYN59130.1 HNH endonuclease [Arthrobacter phage Yang]
MKLCSKCRSYKPLEDFSRNKKAKDGRQSWCRECVRASRPARATTFVCADCGGTFPRTAARGGIPTRCEPCKELHGRAYRREYQRQYFVEKVPRHGWTPDEKRAAMDAVGWKCEICAAPFVTPSDAHVDHDHKCCPGAYSCGKCRRGLLCSRCNTTLGRVGDDVDLLRAMAGYLSR